MPTAWDIPAALPKKKATTLASTIPDYFGTTPEGTAAGSVARLAKTPGADPAIFQQFVDATRLHDTIDASTAPFLAALSATNPKLAAANAQEVGNIDSIYSPDGYQSVLQSIRDTRKKAVAGINAQLIANLRRTLGLNRVGSSGMVGGGLGSYLAQVAAAESGKLQANEAYDAAGQERADALALLAARQSAQGQRQTLTDALLQRLLIPVDVSSKVGATYSDALTRALQQIQLNSFQGVGTH